MNRLSTHPLRIVVVDDERAQAQALDELLRHEGHECQTFTTAQAALDCLARQPADILLTDLQMPGLDGLALVEQALRLDADLVPLLMTGHGTIEKAVAAMKNGAVDFVMKPFRLSELRPVLARARELRHLRLNARELAQRLLERTRQLEVANRELDAFAARVAHDLQGPVQNMVGFAQIVQQLRLSSGPTDLEEELGLLARIVASGQRADTMIRDLLHFARLGNQPLNHAAVPLANVLRQARAMLSDNPRAADVVWRVGELPTVSGDASLLTQVWVNLLSNALKYSAPVAHPAIDITAVRCAAAMWRITVSDNGVGFESSLAHRLFSPFERLHGLAEFPGTGMGLANVRRIIERHGGEVSAEGAVGQGACITFTLPD